MYISKYKLNNSYTTYVVRDWDEGNAKKEGYYCKEKLPCEWKPGAKVMHTFHGKGVICKMSENCVIAQFPKSTYFRKLKNFQVTFEVKSKTQKIENLRLCY